MRLYLDEDIASALLTRLFRAAGHDVQGPAGVNLMGESDAVQFRQAIRYEDFEELHLLVLEAGGHHPGVLVVRRESDPRRNLSPREIVRAVRNLEAAGVPVADEYHILNQWR